MATDKVEVGRPDRLTFSEVQREASGHVDGVTVIVELENLRARREVYLYGAADLTYSEHVLSGTTPKL